jgi:hypothetical protein
MIKRSHAKSFRSPSFIIFISLVLCISASAYYVVYQLDYKDHFLNGDEIADITASVNEGWIRWFTHGFSQYFIIYQEWFTPFTNFLKPVMNAVFFAMHAVFGDRYDLYFLTFFAEIVAAALLVRDAAIETGASSRAAAVTGLLFMINPSIVHDGLVNIPFQNDFLAGFFVLAAFCTLLREWYAATLALTLIACLTKEIAWSASIAACISWAVLYRDRVRAILLLTPLLAILALRYMAFGGMFVGISHNQPGWQQAAWLESMAGLVKGVMLWPLGTIDFRPLGAAAQGHFDLPALVQVFFVGVNVTFWCVLAFLAVEFRRPLWITLANALAGRTGAGEFDPAAKRRLAVFIFLLGALAFGVLGGQRDRYGALIYTFLLLAAAPMIEKPPSLDNAAGRSGTAWIVPAVRLGLAAVLFAFVQHGIGWAQSTFLEAPQAEAKMRRALKALTAPVRKVYVVNAPHTFPAPRFLRAAWGLPFETVYVNQFLGCESGDAPLAQLTGRRLAVHMPDCARIVFLAVATKALEAALHGPLQRASVGEYRFDAARIEGRNLDPRNFQTVNFGDTMTVDLILDDDTAVLAYDWRLRDYRWISPVSPVAKAP